MGWRRAGWAQPVLLVPVTVGQGQGRARGWQERGWDVARVGTCWCSHGGRSVVSLLSGVCALKERGGSGFLERKEMNSRKGDLVKPFVLHQRSPMLCPPPQQGQPRADVHVAELVIDIQIEINGFKHPKITPPFLYQPQPVAAPPSKSNLVCVQAWFWL